MASLEDPNAPAPAPSGPTCSSSFGESVGPADSDVEIEQIRRETADSADSFQRSSKPPRERQLNPEWREFRRSIEWRCRWLELRMREVHLQSLRYKSLLKKMRTRDHLQTLQDLSPPQQAHVAGLPPLDGQEMPGSAPLPLMQGHVAASLHAVPMQFVGASGEYQGVGMVPYLAATWQAQAQLWGTQEEPPQQMDEAFLGGSQEVLQKDVEPGSNTQNGETAAAEQQQEASGEASGQGILPQQQVVETQNEEHPMRLAGGEGDDAFLFSPLQPTGDLFDHDLSLDAETAEFARNALASDEGFRQDADSEDARHGLSPENDKGEETDVDEEDLSCSAARIRGYPDALLPAGDSTSKRQHIQGDPEMNQSRKRERNPGMGPESPATQEAPSTQLPFLFGASDVPSWDQGAEGYYGALGTGPSRRKRLCRRRPHASFSLASESAVGGYFLQHPVFSRYEKKLQQQAAKAEEGGRALAGNTHSLLDTPWGPSSQQVGAKKETQTGGAAEEGPHTVVQSPGHGHPLAPEHLIWRVHLLQSRLHSMEATLAAGLQPKKAPTSNDSKKPGVVQSPAAGDSKKSLSDSKKLPLPKPSSGATGAPKSLIAKPSSLSKGGGVKKSNSKPNLKPSVSGSSSALKKSTHPRPSSSDGSGPTPGLKKKPKNPSSASLTLSAERGALKSVSVQSAEAAPATATATAPPKLSGVPSPTQKPPGPSTGPSRSFTTSGKPGNESSAPAAAAASRKLPAAGGDSAEALAGSCQPGTSSGGEIPDTAATGTTARPTPVTVTKGVSVTAGKSTTSTASKTGQDTAGKAPKPASAAQAQAPTAGSNLRSNGDGGGAGQALSGAGGSVSTSTTGLALQRKLTPLSTKAPSSKREGVPSASPSTPRPFSTNPRPQPPSLGLKPVPSSSSVTVSPPSAFKASNEDSVPGAAAVEPSPLTGTSPTGNTAALGESNGNVEACGNGPVGGGKMSGQDKETCCGEVETRVQEAKNSGVDVEGANDAASLSSQFVGPGV